MTKKILKLKIDTQKKSYELSDSVLYRVTSKKNLAKILLVDLKELKYLSSDVNYRCFVDRSSRKPRNIESPSYKLDKVQTRIASLLCRVKQPEYIHSGIKGKSHITNAKEHIGKFEIMTTDLQSFFQSTTRNMVFKFFRNKMQCVSDVANLLSHLCTCKGHIPTGSRISMPLAFWANEPMFKLLNKISCNQDIKMTVFVDDITFSGKKVNSLFKCKMKKIISNYGHQIHPIKTILYNSSDIKIVTGVAVGENGIMVRNKHHRLIYQDMILWLSTKGRCSIKELNNRLLGRINSQSTIDSRFKDKARTLRNSIKQNLNSKLSCCFVDVNT